MKKNIKPFDMNKKPNKPRWYFKILIYIVAPLFCLFNRCKVKTDKAVKKIKGPYFILATHHAFIDFAQLAYGIMPRTTNWVMAIDEFRRGEWLMRGVGGIPKRKFTHDISTAKNILHCLKQLKQSCAIYPEARYSLVGLNERLDGAIGKFCKFAGVPVVMCKSYGNFINSPQWSKHPYRKIKQEANIYLLFTPEELKELSAEQIQERIEKAFEKDEYKWQAQNNLHTKCKKRADGLYRILYKCPNCGTEFEMKSEGIHLWCEHCKAKWEMDTLSRLHGVNTDKGFSHIPDWYNWEREEVRKEVQAGTYCFEDQVRVEEFYSSNTGFVEVGEANVVHDKNGYSFKGIVNGKEFKLQKTVADMYSVHIEYDFLNRGDAFDIATDKITYFMYPKTSKNCLTKLHFATEELYDYYVRNK